MNKITIIISTMNERILEMKKAIRIVHPQIKYLIIHQNKIGVKVPDFLKRNDIEVICSLTKGLSKSRNIGLRNCTTEYALISDDDVEYIESGIIKILEIIKNESPDFATFKIKTPDNEPEFKDYPLEKLLSKKMHIAIASIEILLNVKKIKNKRLAFDERFGLGTKLRQGEEEIFIHDLIQYNFDGYYYPIFVVKHPYESTGARSMKEILKYMLKGAYSQRMGIKYKVPKFDSLIRSLKNNLFFYIGKIYILSTKRTYL